MAISEYAERFNAFYKENQQKTWCREKYVEVPILKTPWIKVVLRGSFGSEPEAKIWRSISFQVYAPKLKTPESRDSPTHEWRDVMRICLSPFNNASPTIEVVTVYDQPHKSVETVTLEYDINGTPRIIGITSAGRDDMIAHKNQLRDYGFYDFSELPAQLNFPATFDNIFSSINIGNSNIPSLIPDSESSSKTLPAYWYLQGEDPIP